MDHGLLRRMLCADRHLDAQLLMAGGQAVDVNLAVMAAASPAFVSDGHVKADDLEPWAVRAIVADIYACRFDERTQKIDTSSAPENIGISCKRYADLYAAALRFQVPMPRWVNISWLERDSIGIVVEPKLRTPIMRFDDHSDEIHLKPQNCLARRSRIPRSTSSSVLSNTRRGPVPHVLLHLFVFFG